MRVRSLLPRLVLFCLAVNLGGGACMGGCCGRSEESARYDRATRDTQRQELATFVFQRPIGEVWPELLGVLAEHGYPLAVKEPVEGRTLETAFKSSPPTGEYRVLVRINRIDAGHYQLSLEKQYRNTLDDGGIELSIESHETADDRVEMLFAVVERTEPARAVEIAKRAKEKADRSAAIGRGCDRGCAACANLAF